MASDDSPPDEIDRPWEQPGYVRRDCDPHRGDFLCTIASLNLVLCVFSCPFLPVALISLPVGLLVSFLARRDLVRMARKEMDPEGRFATFAAQDAGLNGALVSFLGILFWVILLLVGMLLSK